MAKSVSAGPSGNLISRARPTDVYGREHVPVVTAAEAAAHDRIAQQRFDIPERVLMSNAGRALALITHALFPDGVIAGAAGKGNNGGDTLIAVDALRAWGREVTVVRLGDADGDVAAVFAGAAVILDGILGTGANGPPRGDAARMIRALNASTRPILAVDLPSGTNPDTGAVYDDAVNATATVSFGFPKRGLLFHPARMRCGRMIVVEMGFPPLDQERAHLITPEWAARRFPQRAPTANKGSSGRLLLIAGSEGMAGAAVIAGGAAVRSGAGLVRIASARENREILQKTVPEATFLDRAGTLDIEGMTAIVAGPGMGDTGETRAVLLEALHKLPGVPLLLDADGLNVFAADTNAIAAIAAERPLAITPHAKEMHRLTGKSIDAIVKDPVASAEQLANAMGATVLLKGQPSVIAAPGEATLVNTVGSSDAGVAGMGDQLAGTIGAMIAANLDVRTAAALGIFYSARAADLADLGRALTPRDVSEHMAQAFADPGLKISDLNLPFITFDQPARW